ncbi:MAG: endonuclease, partial [Muribaculaceae bacterium]|nr:endonuclease [Muribaculaceae bacterium]
MKARNFFAFLLSMGALTAAAAAPDGYYDSCKGKNTKDLLKALSSITATHTNVGYDGLWNVYKTSDVRDNGTLWDMYSTKQWPSNFTKCGNYSQVGDCVNREHSFPKSWWGGGKQTQYSDAYHLYPTDGKVNGQRSNYPFGECANGTTLAPNGNVHALGKVGTSTFPGYSGKVFEPDDEYKGDFARTYFYLAAAYNSSISGWTSGEGSSVVAGNDYPVFKQWVIDLFLKWHREDPVSTKEKDRNDAVYSHQHNRNPFIDCPEMVEYIWGDKKDQAWGSATQEGSIVLPVAGSTIDLGTTGPGVSVSKAITIRGNGLSGSVSVSATNSLGLSRTSFTAAEANAGAELTLSWKSSKAGSYTSTLTVTSGSAVSTATVHMTVTDGLPALAATYVSYNSFVANWAYVGDDTGGKYTLDVREAGTSIDGYPRSVDARTGNYLVDGLTEKTEYTYSLKSATLTSNTISVTTGAPLPGIEFLYDGDLRFHSEPGMPSLAEEILVDFENIDEPVKISVDAPFQVSTDKNNWSTTVTLQPEEDSFFMRLYSQRAGTFTTDITGTVGDFAVESGEITGVCTEPGADFLETFEANVAKTYTNGSYEGSAAKWTLANVGVVPYTSQGDRIYEGNNSCRFGKSGTRTYIELAEDQPQGAS